MSKTLFPFQVEGADFLGSGGTLLADEPGLGKSVQALTAAAQVESRRPILVVAPAVAIGVWEAEIKDLHPDARVLVLTPQRLRLLDGRWTAILVSQDLLTQNLPVQTALRERSFDVCIGDEAHNYGNPTSQRTSAVLLDPRSPVQRSRFSFLLTGTPASMHAGQLWSLITATEPQRIANMTYQQFLSTYCRFKMVNTPGGKQVRVPAGNRSTTVSDLRPRLAAGDHAWWLRRRREAVLEQMPAVLPTRVVPVDASDLTDYADFLKTDEGRLLSSAIEAGTLEAMRGLLRGLDEVKKGSLARLRRLIGVAKAEAAARYALHLLDDFKPNGLLVWCYHTQVMDILEQQLLKAGKRVHRIDGVTSAEDSSTRVRAFQAGDGDDVFLGQIVAASVSITLTRGNYSLFVERHSNPAIVQQALDRTNRIGQLADTLYSDVLVLKGTYDELIEQSLDLRTRESGLLYGDPVDEEN